MTLSAQGRLGKDMTLAPDASSQIALAQMSAAAWEGFVAVRNLESADIAAHIQPYHGLFDDLESRLRPGGWWERVVKTYVILGFFADLQQIILGELKPAVAAQLRPLPSDFGHGKWAEEMLLEVVDQSVLRDRLSLWGRRVFGDVISTTHVALNKAGFYEFDENMATRLRELHGQRMSACQLAG